MSELVSSPEQKPVDPVITAFLETSRVAYETLERLRLSSPRDLHTPEHEKPDVVELETRLGGFAASHLDDLDSITSLALPETVHEAGKTLLARLIKEKLAWAVYKEYKDQQTASVLELLADKTILATSLRHGHGHSDGYGMTSGGYENMAAMGKVLSIDLSLGTIYIGKPGDYYGVGIWGRSYDQSTRKMAAIEQESVLEIVEDPKKVNVRNLARLAKIAAEAARDAK